MRIKIIIVDNVQIYLPIKFRNHMTLGIFPYKLDVKYLLTNRNKSGVAELLTKKELQWLRKKTTLTTSTK